MLNPFAEVNWHPAKRDLRKFAWSLIIGFPALAIIFALIHWARHGAAGMGLLWLALIGAGVGALCWLLPRPATPLYLAWYFVACCIGYVVSNTLLALFYYGIITPIGLVMRIFGRDAMHRRPDPEAQTYWRDVKTSVDSTAYYRQF